MVYSIETVSVLFFATGAAVGSFCNVLADRLPEGKDVVRGRSECPECHRLLRWYDLIPVLSFILLRRKCRYCKAELSFQYLVSELVMGGAFVLAFLLWGRNMEWATMFSMLTLWAMLFVTGVIDYKEQIIIDRVLLGFSAVGVAFLLIAKGGSKAALFEAVFGVITGFVFYGIIYAAARLILKREGFGFGDVLLLAAIGAFLGPAQTLVTGILSFYCCVVFIIILKIRHRQPEKQREIPFAPSVCVTAFVASLYGEQAVSFFLRVLGYR